MDMCHGPLLKQIVKFSVPLFLSGLLQLAFHAADLIVIGRYASAQSLGAVGVTNPMIGLLLNIFCGVSVGGSVVVAQYFGAKDRRNTSRAVHTAVTLSLYGGFIIMLISFLVSKPLLELMRVPADVIHKSCVYMWIYCCGIPFSIIYNFCYGVLRAVGDTKKPTWYLIYAGILNVILNLIFVLVFKLDVVGVALATVISQGLSMVLIVRNLLHSHDASRLNFKLLKIHPHLLKHMLRIGLPAGFQSSFYSITNMALMSSVATFGSLALAGNAVCLNLEGLLWMTVYSFHQAALSFVGQNFGGGYYDRAKRSILYCVTILVPLIILMGWTCFLYANKIVAIYNPDPDVVFFAREHMRIAFTLYAICGVQEVIAGSLRGLGVSLKPAITGFFAIFVLRMLWVTFAFPRPEFHSMFGIYTCYPFSWTLALIPNLIMLILEMRKFRRELSARQAL